MTPKKRENNPVVDDPLLGLYGSGKELRGRRAPRRMRASASRELE
jgi:hypothetical protein